jgi:hypothetical protein
LIGFGSLKKKLGGLHIDDEAQESDDEVITEQSTRTKDAEAED